MNERIQELADKAKKLVPHGLSPDKWIEVYNEKFAELVVVKCANIVWHEADINNDPVVNEIGYKIIEQFGLEK